MIKLLIADDHQMFIDGLKLILEQHSNVSSIKTALNGREVVDVLEANEIDILLLDIDMPLVNGEETLEIVQKRYPDVKIIMVTMHDEPSYVAKYIGLNVDGYILKNTSKDDLFRAIETVYEGREYFPSELVVSALMHKDSNGNDHSTEEALHNSLSEREMEIMKHTCQGKTIPEIADELCLSANTIKSHRKNIMRKLEVNNAAGIINYANEYQLLN